MIKKPGAVQAYKDYVARQEKAKPEEKDRNKLVEEMQAVGVMARIVARDAIGSELGQWVRYVPTDQHEAMAYAMGFVEGGLNAKAAGCRLRVYNTPQNGILGELQVLCSTAPGRTLQKA